MATIMTIILLREFGGPDWLAAVLVVAAAALVLSGFHGTPPRLRHTSYLLFAVSALLLPFTSSPLDAIQRGVFISSRLLAMLASVMLIAQCALRSPRVQAIGTSLRGQPPQRRYLSFTMASQLFCGMLGLAGAHIMLVMAAPAGEASSKERTAAVIAVMRGFSTAGFWSPVYGNMVLLLALYPSLHWIEIFPVGVVLAQLALLVGVLTNRRRQPTPVAAMADSSAPGVLRDALPLLVAMLGFFGLILATSGVLSIGITPALIMLAPLSAVAIHLMMSDPGQRTTQTRQRLGESARLYPRLASEALLFLAAGCAGSVMADAFPVSWVQHIGQALDGLPFLGIAFLMLTIMGIALTGIHPVLTAVFLASTITPEVLGLPAVAHMAAILTGWGLSAVLTPFSVLSLTASRYAGTTLYQISFGKNWVFALINALLACIALTVVTLALR